MFYLKLFQFKNSAVFTVTVTFFVQNDLSRFVDVLTVFGVNYVIARFASVVISCNFL